LGEARILDEWDRRGATLLSTVGFVKLGVLALQHKGAPARHLAMKAIARARDAGIHRYLRWWLRQYRPHADWIAQQTGGVEALVSFADAEPDAWHDALLQTLDSVAGAARQLVLEFLERNGTAETAGRLRRTDRPDIADLRRVLIARHATHLYIRSFGAIVIHRGSWSGEAVSIEKRRMRALLALLIANYRSTLTREMALDLLWPESDPSSAINSLNQAVFQLRRVLDPGFRDGDSPQYVLSSVDAVQLNPALTVTDLDEFRRLAAEIGTDPDDQRADHSRTLVEMIRGEFLADLRYDDWAVRMRTAVHSEVRQVLMPFARQDGGANVDIGIRAACALLELDPYDEEAQLALASRLDASGRRAAARKAVLRFAKKLKDDLDESPSAEMAEALAGWVRATKQSTYS
jgi:DNA-binding SARP family transcriptional activator